MKKPQSNKKAVSVKQDTKTIKTVARQVQDLAKRLNTLKESKQKINDQIQDVQNQINFLQADPDREEKARQSFANAIADSVKRGSSLDELEEHFAEVMAEFVAAR